MIYRTLRSRRQLGREFALGAQTMQCHDSLGFDYEKVRFRTTHCWIETRPVHNFTTLTAVPRFFQFRVLTSIDDMNEIVWATHRELGTSRSIYSARCAARPVVLFSCTIPSGSWSSIHPEIIVSPSRRGYPRSLRYKEGRSGMLFTVVFQVVF